MSAQGKLPMITLNEHATCVLATFGVLMTQLSVIPRAVSTQEFMRETQMPLGPAERQGVVDILDAMRSAAGN